MITESSISKFYEDVKRLGLKFPVAAVSKATGYKKGQVSQYLSKKDSPSENFVDAFYKAFDESLKKVPREGGKKGPGAINFVDSSDNPTLLEILANLSESHRNLTAAHEEIAQSNNKLSAANHTLAGNEKMLLEKIPTAHVVSDNSIGDASILVPLVDILAGIASGKTRYRSKEEAVAELGMKLSLHKPGKGKLKSTPSGAGK